jgi:hypothetical protein
MVKNLALKMTKAKPQRLSFLISIAYGDFDPGFSQVATGRGTLYIADSRCCDGQGTKPSKAIEVKSFKTSKID